MKTLLVIAVIISAAGFIHRIVVENKKINGGF